MSPLALLIAILIIGLFTFSFRYSSFYLADRFRLPGVLQQALQYVPVAALTALVIPTLVFSQGGLAIGLDNHRLLAGLLAGLVAWRTRNTLVTLVVGMSALWILQALGG